MTISWQRSLSTSKAVCLTVLKKKKMGGKQSTIGLGAKSTALEVWEHFTIEYGRNVLENKTVIVTGTVKD
jgi:hypothetical protein